MESAKIALFEDNKGVLDVLPELFKVLGHEVVALATSMQEVPDAVDVLEGISRDDVVVAIVDGDLGTGFGDGPAVIGVLRERLSKLVVIGNSAMGEVNGADQDAYKDLAKLIEIISAIPSPEK